MIVELNDALRARGIKFCFAELKDPVKDKLKRFGLFMRLGEHCFFPTVGAAVSRYLKESDVEWVDWEDEAGKTHLADAVPVSALPPKEDIARHD